MMKEQITKSVFKRIPAFMMSGLLIAASLMPPSLISAAESAGHVHDESCYETVEEAYMICSKDSLEIHKHDESCKNDNGELSCMKSEDILHTHDSWCYDQDGSLLCDLTEQKEHDHDVSCYQPKEDIEASVIDESLAAKTEQSGEIENAGESVNSAEMESNLNSDKDTVEDPESSENLPEDLQSADTSIPDDSKLYCELEEIHEHIHDDSCYEQSETDTEELFKTDTEMSESDSEISETDANKLSEQDIEADKKIRFPTCGKIEIHSHQHDAKCREIRQVRRLICTRESDHTDPSGNQSGDSAQSESSDSKEGNDSEGDDDPDIADQDLIESSLTETESNTSEPEDNTGSSPENIENNEDDEDIENDENNSASETNEHSGLNPSFSNEAGESKEADNAANNINNANNNEAESGLQEKIEDADQTEESENDQDAEDEGNADEAEETESLNSEDPSMSLQPEVPASDQNDEKDSADVESTDPDAGDQRDLEADNTGSDPDVETDSDTKSNSDPETDSEDESIKEPTAEEYANNPELSIPSMDEDGLRTELFSFPGSANSNNSSPISFYGPSRVPAASSNATGNAENKEIKVNKFNLSWKTEGNTDGSTRTGLIYETSSPDNLNWQLQLDYKFTSETNLAPGEITFIIPDTLFKDRNGEAEGVLTLPVPEAPDMTNIWNYTVREREENGEKIKEYLITNTVDMINTISGTLTFSFREMNPVEIVSHEQTEEYSVDLSITPSAGEPVSYESNPVTAELHTDENINAGYKRGVIYETVTGGDLQKVLPTDWGKKLSAGKTESDYFFIDWTSYIYVSGNQPFTISVEDIPDAEVEGIFLGSSKTATETKIESDDENNKVTQSISSENFLGQEYWDKNNPSSETETAEQVYWVEEGNNFSIHFYFAYPRDPDNESLDRHKGWPVKNEVTYTMTLADEKLAKTYTATGIVNWKEALFDKSGSGGSDVTKWGIHEDGTGEGLLYNRSIYNESYVGEYSFGLNELISEKSSYKTTFYYNAFITLNQFAETFSPVYKKGSTPFKQDGTPLTDTEIKNLSVEEYDAVTDNLNNYGLVPSARAIEDLGLYEYRGENSYEQELTTDEYVYKSLKIIKPQLMEYVEKDDKWVYQTTTSGDLKLTIYGSNDKNSWTEYGTAVWDPSSQKMILSANAENGGSSTDDSIIFKDGVKYWRVETSSKAALIYLVLVPEAELTASNDTLKHISEQFESSEKPEIKIKNRIEIWRTDPVNHGKNDLPLHASEGHISLRGASQGAWLTNQVENLGEDIQNQIVKLKYSADIFEQTSLKDIDTYERAVASGSFHEDEDGTVWNLLPPGVIPYPETLAIDESIPSSASSSKPTITYYKVHENWRGSGRIMLETGIKWNGDLKYIEEDMGGFTEGYGFETILTFEAGYPFEKLSEEEYGDKLVNLVTYGSNEPFMGTVKGLKGEMNDPDSEKGHNNQYTSLLHQGTDAEKDADKYTEWLKGLIPAYNPDENGNLVENDQETLTLDPSYFYSKKFFRVISDQTTTSGISKLVTVDGSGFYSSGLPGNDQSQEFAGVNAYGYGTYTYRFRIKAAGKTQNILFADVLDSYKPEEEAKAPLGFDESKNWKGSLLDIDLSSALATGADPVIWVWMNPNPDSSENQSSIPDLRADVEKLNNTESGRQEDIWQPSQEDGWTEIGNNEAWQSWKEKNINLMGNIAAIAIDCSSKLKQESHSNQQTAGSEETEVNEDEKFTLNENEILDVFVRMQAPAYIESSDSKENAVRYAFNELLVAQTHIQDAGNLVYSSEFSSPTRVGLIPYNIDVVKIWDDLENRDHLRPDSVNVYLHKNGNPYKRNSEETQSKETQSPVTQSEQTDQSPFSSLMRFFSADGEEEQDKWKDVVSLTLNSENEWKGAFTNLPYADKSGVRYEYTVVEDPIPEEYSCSIFDSNPKLIQVTNKYRPETILFTGEKRWEDEGNSDMRPSSITLRLFELTVDENGKEVKTEVASTTTSSRNKWKFRFEEVPKYRTVRLDEKGNLITDETYSGPVTIKREKIQYVIEEDYVNGYAETHTPITISSSENNPDQDTESTQTTGQTSLRTQQNVTFTNTWDPYTSVSLTKKITNMEDESIPDSLKEKLINQEFTFEFELLDSQNTPVPGAYSWKKYTVDGAQETGNGTISHGEKLTLKHNEKVVIEELPSITDSPIPDPSDSTKTISRKLPVSCKFTEEVPGGYTLSNPRDLQCDLQAGRQKDITAYNRYSSRTSVVLKAEKELLYQNEPRDPNIPRNPEMKDNQFRFQLVEIKKNEKGKQTEKILDTAYNTSNGDVIFSALWFSQNNDGKTSTYEIREQNMGVAGITTDPNPIIVTVKPEDDGKGNLSAEVLYSKSETGNGEQSSSVIHKFTNKYHAEGKLEFEGIKSFPGHELADREFEFALYRRVPDENGNGGTDQDTDGNTEGNAGSRNGYHLEKVKAASGTSDNQDNEITVSGVSDKNGQIKFNTIPLTEADLGTTVYEIEEVVPEQDNNGILYDRKVKVVTVVVTDNKDGTLTPSITKVESGIRNPDGSLKMEEGSDSQSASLSWTNKYKDGQLVIQKKLAEGSTIKNPTEDPFLFNITIRTPDGSTIDKEKLKIDIVPITEQSQSSQQKSRAAAESVIESGTKSEFEIEIKPESNQMQNVPTSSGIEQDSESQNGESDTASKSPEEVPDTNPESSPLVNTNAEIKEPDKSEAIGYGKWGTCKWYAYWAKDGNNQIYVKNGGNYERTSNGGVPAYRIFIHGGQAWDFTDDTNPYNSFEKTFQKRALSFNQLDKLHTI